MNKETLPLLHQVAKRALLAGGAILKKGFYAPRQIRFKSSGNPVTEIDVASEKAVFRAIKQTFPHHTFLAEESAFAKRGDLGKSRPGRFRWVIDPLDGTVNYIHRIPQSCVSVAVEVDGQVLAGGVYDPFRNELFMAARGKGATMNGKRMHVSPEKKLIHSLMVTGFPYDHQKHAKKHSQRLKPFLEKFADLRRLGAAALDLSWVACGRVEVYWEVGLKPWDAAAGWLLVEEAGGKLTDFAGRPFHLDNTHQTLATNGVLHKRVSSLLMTGRAGSKT